MSGRKSVPEQGVTAKTRPAPPFVYPRQKDLFQWAMLRERFVLQGRMIPSR
jgi:hypothetical protein